MSLKSFLGIGDHAPPALTDAQLQRLAAWRGLAAGDPETPHMQARYVVVDVEATGLDLANDRLLAVGAVAVERGLITSGQSFAAVLDGAAEIPAALPACCLARTGTVQPPAEALLGFLEFAGNAPLVAHRADFPQAMLESAMREHLGIDFAPQWLDLAYLLRAVFLDGPDTSATLEEWLAHFELVNFCPHNAVADALAVARLLQMLIARAVSAGHANPKALLELERMRRRVHRRA